MPFPNRGGGCRVALLCLLASGLVAAPAASRAEDSTGLPPLVTPPNSVRIPGKFVFAELVTPDLASAERFYGGLFGWTFRDVPVERLHYAEALSNGRNVAGLIERPLPPDGSRRPSWLPFIATAATDATVATATGHGGRVLYPARDIPGIGREAVLADPEGAIFAVLQSSSGDPADAETPVADWVWSSLLTPDAQAAAAFYGATFGYQSAPAPDSNGVSHLIVVSDGYARASINPLPRGLPAGAPARWLRFVRVDDVNAMAARAVALGGRVLVQPHEDRDGGTVAVLADPAGAAFGVLEWPGDAPAETAK